VPPRQHAGGGCDSCSDARERDHSNSYRRQGPEAAQSVPGEAPPEGDGLNARKRREQLANDVVVAVEVDRRGHDLLS
jgi:hypothetical protein